MDILVYVIFSTLLAGSLAVLRDLPVVNGAVLASGAGERLSTRFFWPYVLLAGLAAPCLVAGDPLSDAAVNILGPSTVADILPVGLSTAISAMVAGRFGRYPAVPFAFISSLAGVSLANTGNLNFIVAGSYLFSWVAAPVLCALLAAGIYRVYTLALRNKKTHLAVLDARLLGISMIASFLLLAAFAVNYSLLFSFLTQATPAPAWVRILTSCGCAVLLYLMMRKEVSIDTWNISDYELDINSQSISSVILSMAVVLALFSSPLPGKIGMAATPLPVGILFVSALIGISVIRQRALTETKVIAGTFVSAALAPVLAFMLSYCLAKVVDGTAIGSFIALTLTAFGFCMTLFFRWQGGRDIQKRILRARESQLYSTRRSLSALEVKAEMTEKDLLNKLDIKRKELVDFAVGIGDQKRFMESFYEDLKEVRALPDGQEKDARTDSLLSSMRERMYFTSEMNDFYARSEVLHRDFNLRLSEAYPNLTENERKLANLLRQGFSSKYIASLMNIAPKSVEINRYRLRCKLGLQRSDNLIKFIRAI